MNGRCVLQKNKGRFYEIFDVFTDTVLAGNPVAIVHGCLEITEKRLTRLLCDKEQ